MAGHAQERFSVNEEYDQLVCEARAAEVAAAVGFDTRAQWEAGIAASELASNMIRHAGGGSLTLRRLGDPRPGLEIEALDSGPGIPDVEMALIDGYSDGRFLADEVPLGVREGLGSGLGAVARLMDSLEIENRPEGGVRATALKWLQSPRAKGGR